MRRTAPSQTSMAASGRREPRWISASISAGSAPNREVTVSWVDPIIGLRGAYPLNDRFSVSGRADIGGFGVGSELTWQAYGGVNYAFTDAWYGTLGYRYMSIDYEADRLTLDIDLHGPLIGVTYQF